ncbi:MAG: hydroxymethylbilane synthase [Meiothermus sp.]|uniref:hydroxymethylbilane synthase n=1 Tax=Meiothermus sp. TaxID=1955249 RepID=UPI0025CFD26C|nr:hydroxymethylbilane synthase [Meiothermus sp.]MCS7058135.1 hydroxymethylbilane synthase [Meiothermus sp.]MCS7194342.1 hydroxymethylbilane synthase [Meiothermus sp.]MCX7740050.1 hydroxymethylbilane synthase [Meiothermus sp.]MDW8089823.1 hydroxymethylbilane synthase [Meiothermus sp.]MDW8481750.1 hydroxymethylbilane synthase [Meiothermus sp.]
MRVIVIGARASLLAQAQTRWVMERLKENWPETEFKIRMVQSKNASEAAATEALRQALLRREVDIAVYSLKHLPTQELPGVRLAAVPKRVEPREALVGRSAKRLEDLPEGAVVGVNSLRRRAQLLAYRPDLTLRDLEGDVDERLTALGAGEYDALIIGAASLLRLELPNRIDQLIDPEVMLPAAGQGALGLEVRQGDDWAEELAYSLNHRPSFARVTAERAFVRALGAGDHCAAAALAMLEDDGVLVLEGLVASPDGRELIRAEIEGEAEEAAELGEELAHDLLAEGARELLEAIRAH